MNTEPEMTEQEHPDAGQTRYANGSGQQPAIDAATISEPVHVCVVCNLCCDGTLFDRVAVSPEEKERTKGKAQFYTKSNGEIRMRLRCAYLGGDGLCECYQQRPEKCQGYRCELLKSVEAGFTSMQHAIAIAQEAKMLRDKSKEASQTAIEAGGGNVKAKEDVDALIRQIEEQLNLSAPIPAPAVALAKYRYRCFVEWIRLHIKSDHLR